MEAAIEAILAQARAAVAAGRDPNADGLRARLATVARGTDAETEALRQLETIAAVHRAKARLAREPVRPASPARRAPLLTKPTVTGTLNVRRGTGFRLEWDGDPKVLEWEVRFSERPDVRSDYVEGERRVLPREARGVEVPVGDLPFRVAVVGRGRNDKVERRALVSGLTRAGWTTRWQRRPTAS